MIIISIKAFKKKTAKLSKQVKFALAERLTLFMEDPFNVQLNNHALAGPKRPFRRINITGDYRLIYEACEADVARLIDIDTHANLHDS